MDAAFVRHDPPGAPIALVLDSPHSGEWYPDDFDHAPPRARRAAGRGHARRAAVARGARARRHADRGAVSARVHRREPQPRRHRRRAAGRRVAGADRAVAQDAAGHRARVAAGARRRADVCAQALGRGSPGAHRPLLAAVPRRTRCDARCAASRIRRGVAPQLPLDARGRRRASDDPGRERADFVLGDRDGTTCEPAFTAVVADTVRGMGYTVAVNDPYKGVEIVRRHGVPAANRHSLQIETQAHALHGRSDARTQRRLFAPAARPDAAGRDRSRHSWRNARGADRRARFPTRDSRLPPLIGQTT